MGLRERAAVIEDQRGHAQRRVQLAEDIHAVGAVDDAQLTSLVRQAEVGEDQSHLVTVAGDARVIEQHQR